MPRFHVERSIDIQSDPQTVFELVRDFRTWGRWSPWLIAEPECTVAFSEDGHHYSWDGKIVGTGEIAVTAEKPHQSIDYVLTFLKPMKSTSSVRFEFAETDGQVKCHWTMDSRLPWFLFFMTKMMVSAIGMDYDRGLKMLKDVIETGSSRSNLEFEGIKSYEGGHYAGIRRQCSMAEIGPVMSADFDQLGSWIKESGVSVKGVPFSAYHEFCPDKDRVDYTVGILTEQIPARMPQGMTQGEMYSGPVYAIKHTGPYHHLANAWASGMMHSRSKVFKSVRKSPPFETYLNDPHQVPENELVTVVNFPAK